jgi:hypothetical protein
MIVDFPHFVSCGKFNSTEFPSRWPRLRLILAANGFAALEEFVARSWV